MKRRVFCQVTGNWLELPEKCSRVVSFSPSITESLFEMGLGEIVRGISVYCVHPDESIRKGRVIVGSYSTYKKELLEEINPDVIFLTTGYQLEFAKKLSENYPVYAIRLPATLSELIAGCVEAGLVCGYYERAVELEKNLLVSLSKHLGQTHEKRIKTYIEIDLGGPVTFGAYSYITDTLRLLGFENIFENYPSEWLEPIPEVLKENEPDVIIYEPKMFSRSRSIDAIKNSLTKRFGNLKAIEEQRLILTPGIYDFFAHYGPSFVYKVIPFLLDIRDKFLSSKFQR